MKKIWNQGFIHWKNPSSWFIFEVLIKAIRGFEINFNEEIFDKDSDKARFNSPNFQNNELFT